MTKGRGNGAQKVKWKVSDWSVPDSHTAKPALGTERHPPSASTKPDSLPRDPHWGKHCRGRYSVHTIAVLRTSHLPAKEHRKDQGKGLLQDSSAEKDVYLLCFIYVFNTESIQFATASALISLDNVSRYKMITLSRGSSMMFSLSIRDGSSGK
jgi:hypothetical protein